MDEKLDKIRMGPDPILLKEGDKKFREGSGIVINPTDYFWEGIERQLEYLIALTIGETSDRSRLGDINIGILTVREIEGLDDELASTLHNVSNEADNMRWD